VLQGPACAALKPKAIVAKLARMSDLVFICRSSIFVWTAFCRSWEDEKRTRALQVPRLTQISLEPSRRSRRIKRFL
jgi:hypothetical protein